MSSDDINAQPKPKDQGTAGMGRGELIRELLRLRTALVHIRDQELCRSCNAAAHAAATLDEKEITQ